VAPAEGMPTRFLFGRRPAQLFTCISLLELLRAVGAQSGARLWQQEAKSCLQEPCYNAENICGRWVAPCNRFQYMDIPGMDIWLSVVTEFSSGGEFVREVQGAADKKTCDLQDFWFRITYKGRWRLNGPSSYVNGLSLASVDMRSVSFTYLQDEMCTEGRFSRVCKSTVPTLTAACPCQGEQWANNVQRTRDDIVDVCKPLQECLLLDKVLTRERFYFSYRANAAQVCLSDPSLSTADGWHQPLDSGCVMKEQPATCPGGVLSTSGSIGTAFSVSTVLLAVLWHAQLAAS